MFMFSCFISFFHGYIDIYPYIYMYIYICVFMYICIDIFMYIDIYIYEIRFRSMENRRNNNI